MKLEYQLVKQKKKVCTNSEQLNSLISSIDGVKINKSKLTYKTNAFKYGITCSEIEHNNEIMFHLRIESDDTNVDPFEELDNLLEQLFEDNKFIVHVLWNDVYTYYTNKLYPKISIVENKARSIIYLLMTKNVGSKWKENYLPQNVKNKVNQKNNKELAIAQKNIFYSLDFDDINVFLFSPYSLKGNINSFISLIDEDPIDLEKIKNEKKYYETKSNWERFFKDVSGVESIKDEWNKLYIYRNDVAHNKPMHKKDYNEALKLINKIESALDTIKEKNDDIVVSPYEAANLSSVYDSLLKSLEPIQKVLSQLNGQLSIHSDNWKKALNNIPDYSEYWKGFTSSKALLNYEDLNTSVLLSDFDVEKKPKK